MAYALPLTNNKGVRLTGVRPYAPTNTNKHTNHEPIFK